MKQPTDVGDLERNDVRGAMALYKAAWSETNGNVDPDLVHVLFMLQDDTRKLADALEAFAAENDPP